GSAGSRLRLTGAGRYGLVMVCGGETAKAADSVAGSPLPTRWAQPLTCHQCRLPPAGRTFSMPVALAYLTVTTPPAAVPLVPFTTAAQAGPVKTNLRWP